MRGICSRGRVRFKLKQVIVTAVFLIGPVHERSIEVAMTVWPSWEVSHDGREEKSRLGGGTKEVNSNLPPLVLIKLEERNEVRVVPMMRRHL